MILCRFCDKPAIECARIEGFGDCMGETLDCRKCGNPLGRKIAPMARVTNESPPRIELEPPLRPIECEKCGTRTVGVISMPEPTFAEELERMLNRHSQENESGTPDFILAEYMLSCLDAFNKAVQDRESWYGRTANAGFAVP